MSVTTRTVVRLFLVSIASVACLAAAASAQESVQESVAVSADSFSFWDGTRLFAASGHVTVRYKDATITADTMQYDSEAGHVVFRGNVVYAEGDQELAGDVLHYDLTTGAAVFEEMDAVLHAEGVDGPMFVRGQRVEATAERVVIEQGRLTTCECDGEGPPAYHFAARELEIYPGERLVVRGVTFYEHGVPLLYLPYMTLSLREDASRFDFPQVGYSSRTGWYIKTAYNYVLRSGLYGAILLDYFQRLGLGAGVRHTYLHDAGGQGTVLVYGVGNELGGIDGTLEWDRRWSRDPWRTAVLLGYDVSTGPSGIAGQEVEARLEIDQTRGPGAAGAELEYRLATGADPLERLEASGQFRRALSNGWQLNLRADGFEHETPVLRRRWLGYTAELRREENARSWSIRLEQQVNPDLKDEEKSTPSWTHVSRLPEIAFKARGVAGFDVAAGVARLKEEPSGDSAWRGEGQVSLSTRTLRISQEAALTFGGFVQGLAYSTGDRQAALESRIGLSYQLSRQLGVVWRYTYRDAWGQTPFRFDKVSPADALTTRLNWRSAALTASVYADYDFRTRQWGQATVNATARLAPAFTARGTASYDLYARRFDRVAATVDWRPRDEWVIRMGGVYDVPEARLERVDAQLEMAFAGGWKAGLTAIYKATDNSFPRGEVFLSHDEECREIRLTYDHEAGEVWLEYRITAFPSSRVAVGTDAERLMFESDALNDFLEM
ncbi:MAG: LPS-assembly protein LptD [Firmicutes bacterium]|nr:LPS-assembly protein LptD [Bacillota bacterium]